MRFRIVALVALSVPLALAALAEPPAGAAAPAVRGTAPFSEAVAADVIILADESGSMGNFPGELPGERQAAAEIASAAWSKNSQVAIYGFGSAPPREPEPTAVNKICGLTPVATQQDIATLDDCASQIKVRPSGAQNTDFGAALTVAGQVLAAKEATEQGRVPLVFMLTDGTLDLGSGPATAVARQQLFGVILPGLASQHIEVWPVGFGAADLNALAAIAAGGAQTIQSCPEGTGGAPRATAVPASITGEKETEQIQQQLLGAFAAANCATAGPGQWQVIQPGKSVTQSVAVDPLTTLGSIVVNKGNAAVNVTYADPEGGHVSDAPTVPTTGRLDGAAYELSNSGPTATQEALRLDYPVPGQWAVTFHNPTSQAQVVGTQVLWQGQITPDVNFSPTTGDSGKQLRILVRPALGARPVQAADLTRLHVAVTVQWPGGGPKPVPVTFDAADGQFTGQVIVPAGQSGDALVTAIVQAAGVTGAATATLTYKPGGGLGITVSIPAGTRVDPGQTHIFYANVTNLDNTRQPVTRVQFLLSGLGGTGDAWITQPPVKIGSGTGSVPIAIHFGSDRGPLQGDIEWEVAGTTVQHPAGLLDVTVEPPPPWYTQWWPWTALAVVILAGAGLFARRQLAAIAAKRRTEAEQHAEEERREANMRVRDAGLALLRKEVPGDSQFLRWTGGDDGVYERWFEVRRTKSNIPRLVETTHKGSSRLITPSTLRLTSNAQDGTFRLTAPGVAAPTPEDNGNITPAAPVAESLGIREDRPFDPPPGTPLDDCAFVVTRGDAPACRWPDPQRDEQYDDDDMPVTVATVAHRRGWRDQGFERPEPTVYDDFSALDEHGDAGGSGAEQH